MYRLAFCLQIPVVIKCDNGITEDRITALCMLLARFSWPNRLADFHIKFGWKPERVSRIVNTLTESLYEQWKHLLVFDAERLTPERLVSYTQIIRGRGAPLHTCFGFIDGTIRPVARPTWGQEAIYNGWKRVHCLKYQALVCPDGIIPHLYGPVEGRLHDLTVYNESRLSQILEQHANAPDGTPLQIYGDSAYIGALSDHLITPYRGAALEQNERDWNKAMSKIRIIVEWSFKEVLQRSTFLDFSRTQHVLSSPIGLQYPIAVILHNAHVCLHHPQISQYFARENLLDLPEGEEVPELSLPPTLEEYFHAPYHPV